MKKTLLRQNPLKLLGISTVSIVGGTMLAVPSVHALSMTDWQYSMDSDNDSSGYVAGGPNVGSDTDYEIFATAIQQLDGMTKVAIRSNLGLGGADSSEAHDDHIDWGDLIINIACDALDKVGSESLFGVRFAQNESGVSQLGVYGNVTTFELADQNDNPASSFAGHSDWVVSKGGSPQETGTLNAREYFDESTHVPTLIQSGTWLGAVEIIQDTSDWGLEGFNGLGGQTIAFQFESDLIPTEQGQTVCYHLGPECNNDIQGGSYVTDVPTPAAVLPVLSGLFAAAKRKDKKEALS